VPKKRAYLQNKKLNHLAEGVVHNFNNLLSVIVSRATLLKTKVEDSHILSDLNIIQKAAQEASHVLRRLQKPRSKKSHVFGKKEWINLNELLSEVIEMTDPHFKNAIRLSLQFGMIPKIFVWATALREVFMNIILNAVDALSQNKEGVIIVQTEVQGKHLKISISDNGIGMSEATVKQLFKPYFTTKGQRGTGLGLMASYDIIQKHKGVLEVQSTPGMGATFIISLPLPKNCTQKKLQKIPVTAKRIMLVDDEKDYRESTAEFLSLEGYEVEQAQDAQEALQKLNHQKFDLILSDVKMPKLSGCELAQHVKSRHKGTKIILISGFGEPLNHTKMKALNIDGWLQKPCLFEDIAEVIRKTCH